MLTSTGDLRKAAQNADAEHERRRATSTDRAPEAARLRAEMLPRHMGGASTDTVLLPNRLPMDYGIYYAQVTASMVIDARFGPGPAVEALADANFDYFPSPTVAVIADAGWCAAIYLNAATYINLVTDAELSTIATIHVHAYMYVRHVRVRTCTYVRAYCLVCHLPVRTSLSKWIRTCIKDDSIGSGTELEVNHNKITDLDGSASYDPDLPDGAQTVGIDFTWSCRQDEQVEMTTRT